MSVAILHFTYVEPLSATTETYWEWFEHNCYVSVALRNEPGSGATNKNYFLKDFKVSLRLMTRFHCG